jgi:hypothetical protein
MLTALTKMEAKSNSLSGEPKALAQPLCFVFYWWFSCSTTVVSMTITIALFFILFYFVCVFFCSGHRRHDSIRVWTAHSHGVAEAHHKLFVGEGPELARPDDWALRQRGF